MEDHKKLVCAFQPSSAVTPTHLHRSERGKVVFEVSFLHQF